MGRGPSKNTLRSIRESHEARRLLAETFGDDVESGGIASSPAALLWELTRSRYTEQTRLGAAKELCSLEYSKPSATPVNAEGEPVDAVLDDASGQLRIAFAGYAGETIDAEPEDDAA